MSKSSAGNIVDKLIIIIVFFLNIDLAIASLSNNLDSQPQPYQLAPTEAKPGPNTVGWIQPLAITLSTAGLIRSAINPIRSNKLAKATVLLQISNEPGNSKPEFVDRFGIWLTKPSVLAIGFVVLLSVAGVLQFLVAREKTLRLNNSLRRCSDHYPHPIIIYNAQNQLIYSNPAATLLMADLKLQLTNVIERLPNTEKSDHDDLNSCGEAHSIFEFSLAGKTFEGELHRTVKPPFHHLIFKDITTRKKRELKLQFQAYHHPVTCLENQYRFKEVAQQWVVHAQPFTQGQIEIRSFSQLLADNALNKSHQVVIELAAVLDKVCQDMGNDIRLFHIGDKNFALLIPKLESEEQIAKLVSHINQAVTEAQFSGQQQLKLDYGFACFPNHGDSLEALKRNTRIALDASASQEHSDFMLYDERLGETIARQNKLHLAMREALQDQAFQFYFQPQLSLQNNKVIGAEVLLRWQLEGQWIPPAEFIPLAEHSGFILQLGDWVLTQACVKARRLVDMGYKQLVTAVNISPKQFSAPNFVDQVVKALQNSRLPARNLELEITEGVLFNNNSVALNALQKLRKMGVKLAIDDFGTGYSSLSYLKDFPIDKLKIDQSFVCNMHNNAADQSLIRTVIDLGRNLSITLIAEGVEKQDQVDRLKDLGCDEIQGYWYSKPLDEGFFIYFMNHQQPVSRIN